MKKLKFIGVIGFLSLISLLLLNTSAQANHLAGSTLTYSHLGGRQYLVKIQIIRNCEALGSFPLFPLSVLFANAACGQSFGVSLPYVSHDSLGYRCSPNFINCNAGAGSNGFIKYTWEDTITLPNTTSPASNEWRITHGGGSVSSGICCILPVDNMGYSGSNPQIYLEAFLKHDSIAGNNSPQFQINSMPVYCSNSSVGFHMFGPESDGDSVVYSMVPNKNSLTTTSTYIPPTTGTNPFFAVAGSTSIHPESGLIRFTPTQQQNAWLSVLAEEFRQGIKIGEVRIALPVLVTVNAICNLHVLQSFSGCGIVTLPDGRFFASDTIVFDTIPGVNSCDTIKEYNIQVIPIQTTGQISGAAFVARNTSEIYRAQQFVAGSTNTWLALGGIVVSSNNDSAVVSWGNNGTGSVNIVSVAPNGCINAVQKMVEIGNAASTGELKDLTTTLYPQPAQDMVSIKSNVFMTTITVSDVRGAKILIHYPENDSFKLDTQGLNNGLYLVKITYPNQQESQHRLLIQR